MDTLNENGYPLRFIYRQSGCRNVLRRVEDDRRCLRTSLTFHTSVAYLKQSEGSLDLWTSEWLLSTHHPQTPASPPQGPCTHEWTHRRGVPDTLLKYPNVYSAQSGKTFNHHLSEHQWALQNNDAAALALAEHVRSTGHCVDLSKAVVIDSHPFVTTQCLLESWHIQSHSTHWTGTEECCLESTRLYWTIRAV